MKKSTSIWQTLQPWRKANNGKELKAMPAGYLLMQFALATFIVTMLPTMLVPASKTYLDAFELPGIPWWWSLVGLWLLGWWTIQVGALVVSVSHGRALSDQLFAPVVKTRPYRFEAKPPRRLRSCR